MAKKYTPSGYQIINLEVVDNSGFTITPDDNEDSKILFDMMALFLDKGILKKPILLHLTETTNGNSICGIAQVFASSEYMCELQCGTGDNYVILTLSDGGSTISGTLHLH